MDIGGGRPTPAWPPIPESRRHWPHPLGLLSGGIGEVLAWRVAVLPLAEGGPRRQWAAEGHSHGHLHVLAVVGKVCGLPEVRPICRGQARDMACCVTPCRPMATAGCQEVMAEEVTVWVPHEQASPAPFTALFPHGRLFSLLLSHPFKSSVLLRTQNAP